MKSSETITQRNTNMPQVAILLSDVREAKAIAHEFERHGVIADFFNSADDYLASQRKNHFELSVLDISLCLHHGRPLVLKDELATTKFSFFFNDDTERDLTPTYTINHLGYLDAKRDYYGQVKSILKNYNREVSTENELRSLKNATKDFSKKQKNFVANIEALKEKSGYLEETFRLVKELEEAGKSSQFKDVAPSVFDNSNFIRGYTLLELNENKTKLIPSIVMGRKNIEVPSLWLGLENDQPVSKYAHSVARNVVSNLVDGPVISMDLSLNGVDTDAVLLLEVIPSAEFKIDWKVLESLIAGIYSRNKYRREQKVNEIPNNTAINLFDDIKKEKTGRLIAVDLTDIIDYLEVSNGSSFSWVKFYEDFKFSLSHFVDASKIYCVSPEVIAISVEAHVFDECYNLVSETTSRISFLRYFENVKATDIQALSLYVSELPVSEFALMDYTQKKLRRSIEASL